MYKLRTPTGHLFIGLSEHELRIINNGGSVLAGIREIIPPIHGDALKGVYIAKADDPDSMLRAVQRSHIERIPGLTVDDD